MRHRSTIDADEGEEPPTHTTRRLEPSDITPLDPLLALGRGDGALHLRWFEIEELAAAPWWPRLTVTYRAGDALQSLELRPTARSNPMKFEERVREVLDFASRRRPNIVISGWLDAAHLEWEPVDALPSSRGASVDYRSAGEPVVAHRGPPTWTEALVQWLASRPGYPFRTQALEVVLTTTHVYQLRRDGVACRLPLDELRRREGDLDVIYHFGRNAQLVLPDRPDCAVMRQLDEHLQQKPP